VAGSLNLRFTTGAVQAASANQWAPTLDAHEPNPPLSIEDGVVKRAPLITSLWPLSITAALLACTPPNLLLSTLGPQPAPFSQTSWPVPQARAASIELRTWIGQNLSLTTLAPSAAAPFAQEDWPNPQARRALTDAPPPNLLGSTLASQQAAPFVPAVAWENPQLAPLRTATQHYRPSVDPTPQTQPPGRSVLPDPVRLPARVELTLQRSPVLDAPPAAAPFALADWPNPVRQRRTELLYAWQQSPAVPAPPAAPFVPIDWPTPARSKSYIDASTLGGVLVDLTPLRPVDWPLPARKPLDLTRLTWTESLKLPAQGPQAAPTLPIDWPLPTRKPLDVTRLTWTDAFKLPSQAAPVAPPASGDWPNPLRPRRLPDYTVALGLQQSTLQPPAPPFACNTPVPRGAAFPLANRGHVQAAAVWLIGQDKFFGPPGMAPVYDYPNPRGARRSIELRVHSYAFPVDVLAASVPTPIYGWGARGRVGGGNARDPWSGIGTDHGADPNAGIGSDRATAPNTKIGSDEA
jgi:hypothetical protein